jgi:hypothetical protein
MQYDVPDVLYKNYDIEDRIRLCTYQSGVKRATITPGSCGSQKLRSDSSVAIEEIF